VDADDWAESVLVGRVVRPQGNRGEVIVASDTDFGAARFAAGATLMTRVDGRPGVLEVTGSREHQGRWVVAFRGVATIDAAEALRGAELRIPAGSIAALPEGAYYVHDLVGCRVETTAGRHVGIVERVDMAGTPLLILGSDPDEVMVPLAAPICVRIDVARRVIVVDPPEGLIDLNAAGKPQP
jgi:16S rRNA processing protein RimM